jgi:hypothetical protein
LASPSSPSARFRRPFLVHFLGEQKMNKESLGVQRKKEKSLGEQKMHKVTTEVST